MRMNFGLEYTSAIAMLNELLPGYVRKDEDSFGNIIQSATYTLRVGMPFTKTLLEELASYDGYAY